MPEEVLTQNQPIQKPKSKVLLIVGLLAFIAVFAVSFWYIRSEQKPSAVITNTYLSQYSQNSGDLAEILGISRGVLPPVTSENVAPYIRYANSLTRQSDFGRLFRVANTKKAIEVYEKIITSNIGQEYKVFSLNEIHTAFLQSSSNLEVVEGMFSDTQIEEKLKELNLGSSREALSPNLNFILFQNLLMDRALESISITPTKIALARVSMQEYINQMLFRTQIDMSSQASSTQNALLKKNFVDKILANYELYKTATTNTLEPYSYYEAEAAYLMAWTLNRAGIYSENQELVSESYRLFEENIARIDTLKQTNQDVWQLSIFTKIFYSTAVLGSNKDAYMDPEVKENRERALSILGEVSSPEFLEDRRYQGARNWLVSVMRSDMDWVTSLLLLAKYDSGLTKNLKALKWSI